MATVNDKDFRLVVYGDFRSLWDAVREYDFGTDEETADTYRQQILNSRVPDDDEDGPDGRCSLAFCPDDLEQLANVILRWLPYAVTLALWASGKSEEARFEMGFTQEGGTAEIVTTCCRSMLKGKEGRISGAAFEAYQVLRDALAEK